jgi:hypothetical protein
VAGGVRVSGPPRVSRSLYDWLERAAALLASAPTRIADGAPVEPRVTAIILLGGAPRD